MPLRWQDCEQRFADLFGDGCVVKVEPHVQVAGILAPPAPVDKTSLQADLERFSGDWGIELRMEESGGNNIRIILEGAQSAVRQSKPELQNLMGFYAQVFRMKAPYDAPLQNSLEGGSQVARQQVYGLWYVPRMQRDQAEDLVCCRRADGPKVAPALGSTDILLPAEESCAAASVASTEASPSDLRPVLRFQKCVRKLKFIRLAALMSNCRSQSGSFTSASAVGALETNLAIDDEFEEVMKRLGNKKRGSVVRPE
ncbi:unnamed protein product [Symbiodinium natans]|uniref:Uncharacterized protein n=1 Tax=Symbiodinium natans TaxID=878477 RepID=A0A812QTW8_9DINO|nr:unnamed protein product [Symbiodinium natans]